MAVNASFRSFVLDQLSRVVPGVRPRAMFGGVGVYSRDVFFALMAGDTLYLKVDDTNRGDFEARGLGPFRPFGEHGEVMSYYAVDESILEDLDELRQWCEKAIAVGLSKKTKPRQVTAKKKSTAKGGVRDAAKKSSRGSAKKRR
jgi:TfoX/Sxy family transcriptional regulator of competence genes